MRTRLNVFVIITMLFIGLTSCKQGGRQGSEAIDSISLDDIKPLTHEIDSLGEGLPIFYNMYLSVEMSSLFQSSGAVYKNELLNSPDNISDYITSSKKALNLGIYAVDLSYAKVSEQLEKAGLYFNAMQKLAEEMGIPAEYFKNTAERFDRNINNKDSLIKIANEVYMASDNYLRDNERYAASAQMILGGWVEAIHIAADVAVTTKNVDVIERLAEQRVSLRNVIGMLNDYASDVTINKNLQKLKQLQPVFDSFVVDFDSGFDAASASGKKTMDAYTIKIKEISKQINLIRADIVS
jgi:hypothetical protein